MCVYVCFGGMEFFSFLEGWDGGCGKGLCEM